MNQKKIYITQSNYIPWKGFFDAINQVDEVIIYDEMQFTKRDWRNRNLIKTSQGLQWLTIPVETKNKYFQKIIDVKIADKNWTKNHWKSLQINYSKTKCFSSEKDFINQLYANSKYDFLHEINLHFIEEIKKYLKISTPIIPSVFINDALEKNERLIEICKKRNATNYFTGAAAKAYLNENLFSENNIKVHYFDFENYPEYKQLFGNFHHHVSILDLIFNEGEKSTNFMKSFQKND
jgi:WbqC-like protein family